LNEKDKFNHRPGNPCTITEELRAHTAAKGLNSAAAKLERSVTLVADFE
jgi:hypothetical protein